NCRSFLIKILFDVYFENNARTLYRSILKLFDDFDELCTSVVFSSLPGTILSVNFVFLSQDPLDVSDITISATFNDLNSVLKCVHCVVCKLYNIELFYRITSIIYIFIRKNMNRYFNICEKYLKSLTNFDSKNLWERHLKIFCMASSLGGFLIFFHEFEKKMSELLTDISSSNCDFYSCMYKIGDLKMHESMRSIYLSNKDRAMISVQHVSCFIVQLPCTLFLKRTESIMAESNQPSSYTSELDVHVTKVKN
ncbi:hypothetical protein MXB_5213, partial [Myxobolus squamalis]